ncbi:Hypothetical predicted protein [Pelobates cultripes]|uniref:Helix-turn-helix domain-containing protein n=1 Tax=Pelobates cultripes TaxID=61616 RepID=A0AAD1STP6_PELCU|nr:Hypothetical predicted protein [Pelobates cultripes]
MRQVLCASSVYKIPPIEYTLELLEVALKNNYFHFEEQWYMQISGTSMGAAMVPMYANAYMYVFETEHILKPFQQNIIKYFHFINDVLIIWGGTITQAYEMVEHINQLPTPVRMMADVSSEKVHFLDVELSVEDHKIVYSLYSKPADRNTILHYTSAHPINLKNSIPRTQFLRVMRNNSEEIVKQQQIIQMKMKFLE